MPQPDASDIALQPVDYAPWAFDTGAPPVDYGAAWQGLKSAGSAIASSAGKLFGTPPPLPPPAGREEGAVERGLRTAANWLGEHSPSAIDAAMMAMGPRLGPVGSVSGGAARNVAPRVAVSAAASEAPAPRTFGALESKQLMIYNPSAKSPRPLKVDYPAGVPSDASGRITADIEGRPLTARWIAGRRSMAEESGVVGGRDQAIPPAELDAISETATGTRPTAVTPRQIGGDAGRVVITRDPITGEKNYDILLNRRLSAKRRPMVAAHELGHVIDDIAGTIATQDLAQELQEVYSTLATGYESTRPRMLFGYGPDEESRELMVEAIRAYMTDPNYLKTVAPNAAAAIRAAVNVHPYLSKIIQFNTIAGWGAVGASYKFIPVEHDPFSEQAK